MKKLMSALFVIFLLFVGYKYLNFNHQEKMRAEQQQRSDERDALITKVKSSCQSAISKAFAPRRVLDFSHDYGRSSMDFGGFGQTDTGYSYRVIADLGNEKVRLKCYMDESFRVLQVAKDNPGY